MHERGYPLLQTTMTNLAFYSPSQQSNFMRRREAKENQHSIEFSCIHELQVSPTIFVGATTR